VAAEKNRTTGPERVPMEQKDARRYQQLVELAPDGRGAELAKRLRARWPDLPILFMSGYRPEELRQQGAIGSDEITILKPFTSNGLVWSVTEALLRDNEGRRRDNEHGSA
jgi:DNA-binding response OmpR family regulator